MLDSEDWNDWPDDGGPHDNYDLIIDEWDLDFPDDDDFGLLMPGD
jgi:hypothetical protein